MRQFIFFIFIFSFLLSAYPVEHHPADTDSDGKFSMAETLSYALAFKKGNSWPTGPVPIPTAYLDYAVNKWKNSENYTIDNTVSVSPATITISDSATIQFSALVPDAVNTAVTWRVVEPNGGSITTDGYYTSPSEAGIYHVEATSVADITKKAQAVITDETLLSPVSGDNITETLVVDGLSRTALVSTGHVVTGKPPVLLVFHGFGGYASTMESLTKFHQLWPEATVVYPQGLDVVKPSIMYWAPGWPDFPDQYKTPDAVNQYHERDVHFIDALMTMLKLKYRVDSNRAYTTGFSNGATFSYLLYTERPELFNAFAGLGGPATFLNYATDSKPVLTINGLSDGYVPPALAATMKSEFMRANQCSNVASSWQFNSAYSLYPPAVPAGAPLVWYQFTGGHSWISGASEAMVAFFKEH